MEAEITYQLETHDLFATHQYFYKTNKFNKLLKLGVYTWFTVTIIQFLVKTEEALWLKIVAGTLTLAIVILTWNLFMWLIFFISFRANLPKHQTAGVLGKHTMQVTPTQLIESTSVNQSYHQWTSVQQIQELPNHLLIILGSGRGYIIPKRSFSDSSEYRAFHEMARQFFQQSREGIN